MSHQIKGLLIVSCIGLLSLSFLASLVFGSRMIPIDQVFSSFISFENTYDHLVVRERLPRTVFAMIAGAALGVSGALMQSITRNPLADPSILGVNTGASLFVVIGLAFFNMTSLTQTIWLALSGALVTAFLVYYIGSLGYGGATPLKLALSGAATSAALSSIMSAILLPRTEVMNSFRFWQVGSTSGATWASILTLLPFLFIGGLLTILVTPALEAMALGDEMATGLGVKTGTIRILGAVAGVLFCGSITAVAGPISFVGLIIPHVVRLLIGPKLNWIFPISAIGGSVLLTIADVLGRLIGSPSEVEAGIITAFLGGPILIMIALKRKMGTI